MLRRLHSEQPSTFAFNAGQPEWAEAQVTKYPEGRQASAIIPLLWRAQEQEGWLSRPAIEHVCDMLGMAHIRGLEVATFYFMFQLQPVGSVVNIQVCGTTTCMICGAEDLIAVCREKIADQPHKLSADGKFTWEEVECLGACANAPMAQIGKDYYEDLTAERLGALIDELARGEVPVPGPQNGRYASEPLNGLTSLTEFDSGRTQYNASAQRAVNIGDTVKRIDGTEVPLLTPWQGRADDASGAAGKSSAATSGPKPGAGQAADNTGVTKQEAPARSKAKPASKDEPAKGAETAAAPEAAGNAAPKAAAAGAGKKPRALSAPRKAGADDLKMIRGVGPKLETLLNGMGFYHFDQIAKWGAQEIAWVDQNLEGFKGRASRDEWVDQATRLASGEETEFSRRAQSGNIYKNK